MTAPGIEFLTATGRRGVNRDLDLLVEAAARGDIQVRHDRRWDVYVINGSDRPEVRGLLGRLLSDGVLEVEDPDAGLSQIVPAKGPR